jgi:hypothetical protein
LKNVFQCECLDKKVRKRHTRGQNYATCYYYKLTTHRDEQSAYLIDFAGYRRAPHAQWRARGSL